MDKPTRLILYNQYEILKHLIPGNASDYEKHQNILANGYTTEYPHLFGPVAEDELSDEIQKETWEVLTMFRALHQAAGRGWTSSNPKKAKYEGFDGNNDPHYFFSSYLIDMQGLFKELHPNKNSHSSGTINRYRRMLAVWNRSADRTTLTDAEADAVVAA